jgi:hypothetical protein
MRGWHVLRQVVLGALIGAVLASALVLTSGPSGALLLG